jgi:hypothetical protein
MSALLHLSSAGIASDQRKSSHERWSAMSPSQDDSTPVTSTPGNDAAGPGEHPHDFEVQRELHKQIRNDPDYDDWEYGTEPLPKEAWVSPPAPPA